MYACSNIKKNQSNQAGLIKKLVQMSRLKTDKKIEAFNPNDHLPLCC